MKGSALFQSKTRKISNYRFWERYYIERDVSIETGLFRYRLIRNLIQLLTWFVIMLLISSTASTIFILILVNLPRSLTNGYIGTASAVWVLVNWVFSTFLARRINTIVWMSIAGRCKDGD